MIARADVATSTRADARDAAMAYELHRASTASEYARADVATGTRADARRRTREPTLPQAREPAQEGVRASRRCHGHASRRKKTTRSPGGLDRAWRKCTRADARRPRLCEIRSIVAYGGLDRGQRCTADAATRTRGLVCVHGAATSVAAAGLPRLSHLAKSRRRDHYALGARARTAPCAPDICPSQRRAMGYGTDTMGLQLRGFRAPLSF